MNKIEISLHHKIDQLLNTMHYQLVKCECSAVNGRKIFRVFIQCESGVTVEDCAKVSRQMSAFLAVEAPTLSHYTLEVSSPGISTTHV